MSDLNERQSAVLGAFFAYRMAFRNYGRYRDALNERIARVQAEIARAEARGATLIDEAEGIATVIGELPSSCQLTSLQRYAGLSVAERARYLALLEALPEDEQVPVRELTARLGV